MFKKILSRLSEKAIVEKKETIQRKVLEECRKLIDDGKAFFVEELDVDKNGKPIRKLILKMK